MTTEQPWRDGPGIDHGSRVPFYVQLKDPDLSERFITRMERQLSDVSISGVDEFADEQMMQELSEE